MVSDMEQGLRDAPIVEVVIAIQMNKFRRNTSIFGVVIASIAAVVLFVLQHPHPPIYSRVYYCIIAAAVAVVAALAACLFQWNISFFSGELKRRRSEPD
jgi:H+/Cl- antiporter ClcA